MIADRARVLLESKIFVVMATTMAHTGHAQAIDDENSAREVGHTGALGPFGAHTTCFLLFRCFAIGAVISAPPSLDIYLTIATTRAVSSGQDRRGHAVPSLARTSGGSMLR